MFIILRIFEIISYHNSTKCSITIRLNLTFAEISQLTLFWMIRMIINPTGKWSFYMFVSILTPHNDLN